MPQRNRKFTNYVEEIPAEKLNDNSEFLELKQHKNSNPHKIYKKRRPPGKRRITTKFSYYWHVKSTAMSKKSLLPLDTLGYLVIKRLFSSFTTLTQFKMRIWFDEVKRQHLVASKHLKGFQTWHEVKNKIIIDAASGKLLLNNVEIIGYGYLHMLSYLMSNFDLHTRNFGVVPVYANSGQSVQYIVIPVDFDWCFVNKHLTQAVLTTHFSTGDLLALPPLIKDQNYYFDHRFELAPKVMSERYDGYYILLSNELATMAEPDKTHPDSAEYDLAIRSLEARRKRILKAAIQKPSVCDQLKSRLQKSLNEENYKTIYAILSNNFPEIVHAICNFNDNKNWLKYIFYLAQFYSKDLLIQFRELFKITSTMICAYLTDADEILLQLKKLTTEQLDQFFETFDDQDETIAKKIIELLSYSHCIEFLSIHARTKKLQEKIAGKVIGIAVDQFNRNEMSEAAWLQLLNDMSNRYGVDLYSLYVSHLHSHDSEGHFIKYLSEQFPSDHPLAFIVRHTNIMPMQIVCNEVKYIISCNPELLRANTLRQLLALTQQPVVAMLHQCFQEMVAKAVHSRELGYAKTVLDEFSATEFTQLACSSIETCSGIIDIYFGHANPPRVAVLMDSLTIENQLRQIHLTRQNYGLHAAEGLATDRLRRWIQTGVFTLQTLLLIENYANDLSYMSLIVREYFWDDLSNDIKLRFILNGYPTSTQVVNFACAHYDNNSPINHIIPRLYTESDCMQVAFHIKNASANNLFDERTVDLLNALKHRVIAINRPSYTLISDFGTGARKRQRAATAEEKFCISLGLDTEFFIIAAQRRFSSLYPTS